MSPSHAASIRPRNNAKQDRKPCFLLWEVEKRMRSSKNQKRKTPVRNLDFMEPAPKKKKWCLCRDGLERGGRSPKVRDILHRPVGPVLTVRWRIWAESKNQTPSTHLRVSLSRVFLLLTKKKIIEQSNGEPTRIQDCGKEYGQHTKLCSENPGSCFGKRKRGWRMRSSKNQKNKTPVRNTKKIYGACLLRGSNAWPLPYEGSATTNWAKEATVGDTTRSPSA